MKLSATDRRNLQTLLLMSVFEPEAIGQRIAQARKEAGLTQEELGDVVGLATRTVQNHEAGATAPYKHLRAYASVLGRDPSWFIHGEDAARLAVTPDQDLAGELAEVRVLVRALVADQGLDVAQILHEQQLGDEELQPEDEDHEAPGEARRTG